MTPPELWWTPWPGTGPAHEILGDLHSRRVIELGCGRGDNAAACTAAGAEVTGVDSNADKIRDARCRWSHITQLEFVHADAHTYLRADPGRFDVAYSIFGAFSFAPAEPLLDLLTERLHHTGTLAISARLPAPQLASSGHSSGSWQAYTRTSEQWADVLEPAGFQILDTHQLPHPGSGSGPGCIIIAATSRPATWPLRSVPG